MAKADLFDLKIWDQYVNKGYQRRVKMREQWVTLPLVKGSATDPIYQQAESPTRPSTSPTRSSSRYLHAARSRRTGTSTAR